MVLSQLRAFHVVAEAGGFTQAARLAGLTQPTLSSQVRTLEAAYGVRLFERRGRGARLTPLGQSLHQITQRLFVAEDEARALLAGNRWAVRGHLRVAADGAYQAIPVLSEMRRRHRGLTFSLRIGNSADVLAQVIAFEADVAVTALPTSDPRLAAERLRNDRLILFVAAAHEWKGRRETPLASLAAQDLIMRERGSMTREVLEQRMAEAGVKPRTLFEVQTREAAREAVAAGFGVGVVFASEFGHDPRFHAIDIADADVAVAEYAVTLADRRKLALVAAFFDAAAMCAEREGWLR